MVTFSSMYHDRPPAGESEAAVESERRRWPEEKVEKDRSRRSDMAASAGVGGRRREGERGFYSSVFLWTYWVCTAQMIPRGGGMDDESVVVLFHRGPCWWSIERAHMSVRHVHWG
jgi:hypothetical protein